MKAKSIKEKLHREIKSSFKTKTIRTLMATIKENANAKEIFIDFVNGYYEHYHCLVSLGAEQTISKVMQLIKGESAYWFNQQNLIAEKLEWQDEYFAVSVSESILNTVREYIKNQEHITAKKHFSRSIMNSLLNMAFKNLNMKEFFLFLQL